MGFGEAISYNLSNITNFSGRAGRPEFWWWVLAVWIFELIVAVVLGRGNGFIAFVAYVIYLVLWLATIAVGCRRLHDTGKSGWLQLLALIPCIGVIILIVFWVQPGTPGDNAYGPPVG
jgi:uncharacterized membrane protein YhaH (DUF805 family)